MPRGRQYYDPIIQAPSRVEIQGEQRIELYPEQDVRDNNANPKWVARLIDTDGRIVQHTPGSFDHDDALRQAHDVWPGLEVFELREESEDSTWDGMGPSPRLWQNVPAPAPSPRRAFEEAAHNLDSLLDSTVSLKGKHDILGALGKVMGGDQEPAIDEQPQLHALQVAQPGTYVLLEDVLGVLEHYAAQFDSENNPSAALGLREAASALRQAF